MRTLFSPANAFRAGQYVTADGHSGIAVGWTRGAPGKAIVVKMTAGPRKGKRLIVSGAHVAARRGNKGRGALPRLT